MFRLLFERSTDPIWLYDPNEGIFVDCNAAAVNLLGYKSKEELLHARPEDLSPAFQPDGRCSKEAAAHVTACVQQYGGHRFEWLARRADGETVLLEIVATSIGSNGKALHVIVSRDIGERKAAEGELRASQQLLASVVDNLSEAVYRTGPNHELIFANRAYLNLSGYDSLEAMRGVPRESLYANPAARRRLLELLARDGEFRNEEIEYVSRDGRHWWGVTNSVAIRDPKTGRVLYHVGSVKDISLRKKAQEELLELNATLERRVAERTAELGASEARLRTLVEHAPEAIVVFDGNTGRFLSVNAPACELYGWSHDQLTRLTPADVSPRLQPDGGPSAQLAREKMDEALAGGTPVFEWMHRHSSGRLIPTEVRLVRLPAEGKSLLRASIIDNTERKRREKIQQATYQISEAVHASETLESLYPRIHEIVKGLMPANNFYIGLEDANSKDINFPYMTDEYEKNHTPVPMNKGWSGYVLRTGKALLAGEHNAVTADRLTVLADGEHVEAFDCGMRTSAVWLGAPLTVRGRAIGVVVVQDYHNPQAYGEAEKQILTFVAGQIALAIERKSAEAELRETAARLRESEARFSVAFHASPVLSAIARIDNGKFVEVNEAFVNWAGGTREEMLGRSSSELNLWVSAEARATFWSELRTNGCVRNREFEGRNLRNAVHTMLLSADVIKLNGEPHVLIVALDITERKRAEGEVWRALDRERELSQLKSNFVSMVSHEFRTPLGVIMSSAEILEQYFEQLASDERNDHLISIRKNTRRMAELMEEVLVLSRFDAGKMNFNPAPLDLRLFCRRIVDEVLSATNRVCPIELKIADSVTEADADERLLRHIFSNLLSNAVKYSPAGSPVEFEIQLEAGSIVCRVRDSGIGIPETDQQWLFNAFYRGRNVGHRPGTGLGLVIVKRCVELHGGRISLESRNDEGTTATLYLPTNKA
jgi:PAS domain S-box-containing protein